MADDLETYQPVQWQFRVSLKIRKKGKRKTQLACRRMRVMFEAYRTLGLGRRSHLPNK